MGNIIGQTLTPFVQKQIKARQTLHGSGVRTQERTPDQLNVLNSTTAWIKLASGVSIDSDGGDDDRLKGIGFTETERVNLKGEGLAKKYVLYGGVASLEGNRLDQRQGFTPSQFETITNNAGKTAGAIAPDNSNSSYIYSRTLTHNLGKEIHSADSGYAPMPGIVSMEVRSLNRGSLEKAYIKIRANNRNQLEIIDLLYLRLGYTVLLEWGNSIYTSDGTDKQILRNTLVEEKFFNGTGRSYLDFLGGTGDPVINGYKAKYSGNYDGMLAIVHNFSWTFNPDGSYDIDLALISLGDVIESLKTNISIDKGLVDYIKKNPTATPATPTNEDPVEENKDANSIASILWLFKKFGPNESAKINITTGLGTEAHVGNFLKNGDSTIASTDYTYRFYKYTGNPNQPYEEIPGTKTYPASSATRSVAAYLADIILNQDNGSLKKYLDEDQIEGLKDNPKDEVTTSGKKSYIAGYRVVIVDNQSAVNEFLFGKASPEISYEEIRVVSAVRVNKETNQIPNPIDTAPLKTACRINTEAPQHNYLRFGYLLEYIEENVIPLVNGSEDQPSLFSIDYSQWYNYMYSLPNQISLDPRVCIVRNDKFQKRASNFAKVFHELELFRPIDETATTSTNYAYPMNIYLNFDFIINTLNNNSDDKGDISIYKFISDLCVGINKALGGVNNLEPVIDKDENMLRIIDTTPIPGISSPGTSDYLLQLYGYTGFDRSKDTKKFTRYESNFIRNIDLKTAITPGYATMVTVGATANGYVKGVEATAFARWNRNLIDRFKPELIPSNPSSQTPTNGVNEARYNYVAEFLYYPTQCYGLDGNLDYKTPQGTPQPIVGKFNDDIIEKNLSIVTEFYKYIIAKEGKTSQQAGTIGFIPFKMNITMDGISGIKIYNKLEVDSSFLPSYYGDTLDFIITGVSHRLQDNDWETVLETTVMPKTSKLDYSFTADDFKDLITSTPTNTGRPASCPTITFTLDDISKRETYQTAAKEAKKIFPELSNEALAGLLGVLQHESNFNPTTYNSSAGGCGALGLAQFREERQPRLFRFAEGNNLPVDNLVTQLKYLKYELPKYYAKLWGLLKNKNLTLTQYTAIFHISQGLGNSNPYKYYESVVNEATYKVAYLNKDGKNPETIPKRLGYARDILTYLKTL
jgi:hypothetical protein